MPGKMHKYRMATSTTSASKLGNRRRPKFHPKQKGPPIHHIDLASLLRSYPYTTHKFTIFVPHRLPHQEPDRLYLTLRHHITHEHSLSAAFACKDPYCPSHR